MIIPTHMAIIVDGNGRWAKEKGLNRSFGHKAGSDNITTLSLYAFKRGIKYLSLYILSCDNLKRSKEEVDFLFKLFIQRFKSEKTKYMKENIKVLVSGVDDNLPPKLIETIEELKETTKNNTGGILNLCLNYSSKLELLEAFKKMSAEVTNKIIDINDLKPDDINKYLFNELPPIDFLVRTSGEMRLSDFMLYQNAYAELYFPKMYFPDFNELEFDKALEEYSRRDRRFGGIVNEKKSN